MIKSLIALLMLILKAIGTDSVICLTFYFDYKDKDNHGAGYLLKAVFADQMLRHGIHISLDKQNLFQLVTFNQRVEGAKGTNGKLKLGINYAEPQYTNKEKTVIRDGQHYVLLDTDHYWEVKESDDPNLLRMLLESATIAEVKKVLDVHIQIPNDDNEFINRFMHSHTEIAEAMHRDHKGFEGKEHVKRCLTKISTENKVTININPHNWQIRHGGEPPVNFYESAGHRLMAFHAQQQLGRDRAGQ